MYFERINDKILRNGQYLLVSYSGAKNPLQAMFTGFRVVKHNVTTLYYNFATEVPNFLPMAPYGTSPGHQLPLLHRQLQLLFTTG